jgi:hypothetical protein
MALLVGGYLCDFVNHVGGYAKTRLKKDFVSSNYYLSVSNLISQTMGQTFPPNFQEEVGDNED